MANATVGVGTYAGEAARPYVAAAILSADSIANNYISVLENVHSTAVLRKFSGAAIQLNDDCAFTTPSSGQLTLGEAVLIATALKVNEQVCNADLRATWESTQMRGQSSAAPADFTTYVAQYVAAKVAAGIEQNMWAGKYAFATGGTTGVVNSFAGIMNAIVAGSPAHETAAAGAFTGNAHATTGILTHLAALTADAPDAIAGDSAAKIFMGRGAAQLYYSALAATYSVPFLNDGLVARYAGYDVITPAGFPNDTLLLSKVDNLYFGTNLLTDHIQASVLDLQGVTGDDVTRVIMQFSGGCQVVDLDSLSVVRRTS
jgi:hypothetical protein